MDAAVVTGAATGVGLAIARRLITMGLRVYGLGGNYNETPFSHEGFIPMACDLGDAALVEERIRTIIEREGAIFALVNNAKRYPQAPFGALRAEEIEAILKVNLLCPMVMAQAALEGLIRVQGYVVNIASTQPELSRGGCVGAAAAGGLQWFGESLFEELREGGVKVTTIFPRSNRYRPEGSPPPPRERPQSAIDPERVAEAVALVVGNTSGNVLSEIILRPNRVTELAVPPPAHLPYPPPDSQDLTTQPISERTARALARSSERMRLAASRSELREERRERRDNSENGKPEAEATPRNKAKKTDRTERKERSRPEREERSKPEREEKTLSERDEREASRNEDSQSSGHNDSRSSGQTDPKSSRKEESRSREPKPSLADQPSPAELTEASSKPASKPAPKTVDPWGDRDREAGGDEDRRSGNRRRRSRRGGRRRREKEEAATTPRQTSPEPGEPLPESTTSAEPSPAEVAVADVTGKPLKKEEDAPSSPLPEELVASERDSSGKGDASSTDPVEPTLAGTSLEPESPVEPLTRVEPETQEATVPGATPVKKSTKKKTATKKSAMKKAATTKATTKKVAAKKTATKKSATRKTAVKKATTKKAVVKEAATKKAVTKKIAAKKVADPEAAPVSSVKASETPPKESAKRAPADTAENATANVQKTANASDTAMKKPAGTPESKTQAIASELKAAVPGSPQETTSEKSEAPPRPKKKRRNRGR